MIFRAIPAGLRQVFQRNRRQRRILRFEQHSGAPLQVGCERLDRAT
jgi:hypothetical protein